MKGYSICIYGAASNLVDPSFIEAGEQLGFEIGSRNHTLIFGGGGTGLMGACARGVTKAGGKIIGVTPSFMKQYEDLYEHCTHKVETDTMSKRKEYMEENADAFIICPGGVGTLDEFFQIITLLELDQKIAPIIIYNTNGFYDELLSFIEASIEKKFIREKVKDFYQVTDSPKEALDLIEQTLSLQEQDRL